MANLIRNGNFSDSSAWVPLEDSNRISIGGGQALLRGMRQINNFGFGQAVQVKAGETYTIKFEAMRNGNFDIWIGYNYVDVSGHRKWVYCPSLGQDMSYNVRYYKQQTFKVPSYIEGNQIILCFIGGTLDVNLETFMYIYNVFMDDNASIMPPIEGPIPTIRTTWGASISGFTGVWARTGPGTQYSASGTALLSFDASAFSGAVGTRDEQRTWLTYLSGNRYLYVAARYVSFGGSEPSHAKYGSSFIVKSTADVNLRHLPLETSDIYRVIGRNNKVLVIDDSVSGWYRVVTIRGTGWVASRYFISE